MQTALKHTIRNCNHRVELQKASWFSLYGVEARTEYLGVIEITGSLALGIRQ